MDYFRVVNWEKYQHYKDRSPKWIKVYNDIFSDHAFLQLSDAERFHLIGIWILASKLNNKIPLDQSYIKGQTFATSKIDLEKLQAYGFIELYQSDTVLTSECYQNASPEKRREEKEESRKERDRWAKSFDKFWTAYPRKVGKANAKKSWMKYAGNGLTLKTVLDSLEVQRECEQWTKDDGQFIPHPTTWLNGQRWEDEPQQFNGPSGQPRNNL